MITPKKVEHIASLARLELTAGEEKKIEKELSAILEFVEKLNEVNTAGIEPMTGGTNLKNVTRSDEQIDKILEDKAGDLIDAVPEKRSGWINVKAVFE